MVAEVNHSQNLPRFFHMYISKSVIVAPKSSSSWNMSRSLVVINLFIFLVQVNVVTKCANLKNKYKLSLENLYDMTSVQNVIAYYLKLDKMPLILILQSTTSFLSNVDNNANVLNLNPSVPIPDEEWKKFKILIFKGKVMFRSWHNSVFHILNHSMNFEKCDAMMDMSAQDKVNYWINLLYCISFRNETWLIFR